MKYREKLAYLAGIMDGEGSIVSWMGKDPKRGIFNIKVYISSTDKILIDWISENFGGYNYTNKAPSRKTNWKTSYIWVLERAKIKSFLQEICPFLIIKKRRCELAIKLRHTFDKRYRKLPQEILERRIKIVEAMKFENHRGIS